MKNVWYVAFCASPTLGVASLFVKPEFGHCYCFSQGTSSSIIVNFDGSRQVVKEHSLSAVDLAFGLVEEEGTRVLKVVFEAEELKDPAVSRGLTYCVTVVKSCIGLSGCFSYTPYALWKWLKCSSVEGLEVYDINEIKELLQ